MAFTSRSGGRSRAPYAGLNLATHTGDDPGAVSANRRRVSEALGIDPRWVVPLQVHGCRSLRASGYQRAGEAGIQADSVVADGPGVPVAVMVADCAPVALAGQRWSAVAHCGWRGLCAGVIEAAVAALGEGAPRAWLGPTIGPCHFEVGPEVVRAFAAAYPGAPRFHRGAGDKLWFDLPAAVRWVLRSAGARIDDYDPACTYCDRDYFSFRRDGVTGRQAVVVWR